MLATTTVRRNLHLSLITLFLLVALDPLTTAQTIRVDMTASHSTNSFVPTEALGAGIDRMNAKTVEKVYTRDHQQSSYCGMADGQLQTKYRTVRGSVALEPGGNLERPCGPGLLYRQRYARRNDPA